MAKKGSASIEGLDRLHVKLNRIAGEGASGKGVRVGIVETARYPLEKMKGRIQGKKEPPFVAQVAFWNEFGTRKKDGRVHIPSRPFMRNSVQDMVESRAMRNEIKRAVDPKDPIMTDTALKRIGEYGVAIMQAAMKDRSFPPNAPFTREMKTKQGRGNSTTPLIDTGLLRRSIASEVALDKE